MGTGLATSSTLSAVSLLSDLFSDLSGESYILMC